MGWVISNYPISGVTPQANENENVTSAPSGAFQAVDGLLNIAANKDEQWALLDREDLLKVPEFATRENRKTNLFHFKAELETVLTRRPAREWVRELNKIGVPAVLAHPQIGDRGLIASFLDIPGVGSATDLLRIAAKLNG